VSYRPLYELATAVSRRELLAGGAAALAIGTAAGFAPRVFAQAAPHRIDVHHHVSPPTWLDAVKSMKKDNPPMVSWSVQKSLDDMDKGGVATAIHVRFSPDSGRIAASDRSATKSADARRGAAHGGELGQAAGAAALAASISEA
jgi:hypothetical protein